MNYIDAKSNNESCTRDRTSIIFSDDIQFSQNKEMFRVQINNESIKQILTDRKLHKIFQQGFEWDCKTQLENYQSLSSQEIQALYEQEKINENDLVKRIEDQNFYQIKKLVRKYFVKNCPKILQFENQKKKDRFSFEIEPDNNDQRRMSEAVKLLKFPNFVQQDTTDSDSEEDEEEFMTRERSITLLHKQQNLPTLLQKFKN